MTGTPGPATSAHRLRTAVRAVVVLLVAVLSGLALTFWLHTEQAAVTQYNRSALALARLGATRIQQTIGMAQSRLELLARANCPKDGHSQDRTGDCAALIGAGLNELEPLGALGLTRLDAHGVAQSATAGVTPTQTANLVREALTACQPEARACLGISLQRGSDDPPRRVAVLAVAVRKRGQLRRAAALFDWDTLGARLTEDVALDPDGLAWLLDETGRLIYHPSNPDVCNQGVQREDARCQVCHQADGVAHAMREGQAGTGSIDVAGSLPKLVAFSPVRVVDKAWTLAVAVPVQAVVDDNRRILVVAILVSGLLIGLFLVVTYFLDRENRRQIRVLEQNQATIRQLNTELEDKVRERTDELRRLYDRLREVHRSHENRERLAIVGELAAVVAHEIRNPLNALAINAERLVRKLKADPGPEQGAVKEMIQGQLYEVRRINDYIEQYLKLARPPKRQVVRADLNKLIGDLLGFMRVEGERLGVQIAFTPSALPVVAQLDEEQIRQVMLNLIVNAFQAMPEGGTLRIETSVAGDRIEVRISDTGVGIAVDRLVEIFKPFVTSREGGTGLGLAICERIVKAHAGELTCRSTLGQGTTFLIRLPISAEEAR